MKLITRNSEKQFNTDENGEKNDNGENFSHMVKSRIFYTNKNFHKKYMRIVKKSNTIAHRNC